ncbi:MAG: hypothetical protein EXS35_10280 [Pedosphaera sp.]|nr:hypothetical protein [Pedosphaera sp.]
MRTIKRILATLAFAATALSTSAQIQFTGINVTADQSVQMRWTSESNIIYAVDYADEISDSIPWKRLYERFPAQGTNTIFTDGGVYYQGETVEHPRNFSQRFYRVVATGSNDVAPPVVFVTSPTNGFVASGLLNISVTSTGLPAAQIRVFVDGEEVRISTTGETNFTINTCEWPNGLHFIFATVDGSTGPDSTSTTTPATAIGVSSLVQVTFNNFISQYTFSSSWFQPSLGQTQHISALFADCAAWTLTITNPSGTVVRTATGTSYKLNYDWDGTDSSGNLTPDGIYSFGLTASNATGCTQQSASGGGSSEGPPSPSMASFASGEIMVVPTNGSSSAVPLVLYPPDFDLSDHFIFEAGEFPELLLPEKSESQTSTSSVQSYGGTYGPLDAPTPSSPQSAPQPSRPETRRLKNTSGTIGIVALDQYGPANNKPPKIIGTVNIDGALPLPDIRWPRLNAIGFRLTMAKGSYTNVFSKTKADITSGQLQGTGSNVFNSGVDFGMMFAHGVRGTTLDDRATTTPSLQTYIPFPPIGGQYDWIPISKMKFGGSRLKWMGIFACSMLYADNYNDLYNKNVLPLGPNMHMFLSGSTTLYTRGFFGGRLGQELTGISATDTTNAPAKIWDGWRAASKFDHRSGWDLDTNSVPGIVKMRVVYWPGCLDDTIYEYVADSGGGDDQSVSQQDEKTVFDPANPTQ